MLLLCSACGHSESMKNREIHECPKCESTKIELIPYSKTSGSKFSSGWSATDMVAAIFGIMGGILLFSGLWGWLVGGTVLTWLGNQVILTLIIIGVIVITIAIGVGTKGKCLYCCAGC